MAETTISDETPVPDLRHSRDKLSRGESYPLSYSEVVGTMADAGVEGGYYLRFMRSKLSNLQPWMGSAVMHVSRSEMRRGYGGPPLSIWVHSVASAERNAIHEAFIGGGLNLAVEWMAAGDVAPPTWRQTSHTLDLVWTAHGELVPRLYTTRGLRSEVMTDEEWPPH